MRHVILGNKQPPFKTYHGLEFSKVIDSSTNAPDAQMSCCQVDVAANTYAAPHVHSNDVMVLVEGDSFGAYTVHGPNLEFITLQMSSKVIWIPGGTFHFVSNPFSVPVKALEFRCVGTVDVDNVLLPHLDDVAARQHASLRDLIISLS